MATPESCEIKFTQAMILDYILETAKMANQTVQAHMFSTASKMLNTQFKQDIELDQSFKYKLKSVLIDAIIDLGVYMFIPMYNEYIGDILFINTDKDLIKKRESAPMPSQKPPIPAEKLRMLEALAAKKCANNQLYMYEIKSNPDGSPVQNPRDLRDFKVGELVRAKDCNGKWWISRVLHVYVDNTYCDGPHYPIKWYLVHFEGFSDRQNEWIQLGSKIQKFYHKNYFSYIKEIGKGADTGESNNGEYEGEIIKNNEIDIDI